MHSLASVQLCAASVSFREIVFKITQRATEIHRVTQR